MSLLKKLDKHFELVCLAILLIIMTVLSFANVVMRYCFKAPIYWSDEVCCYCLALSAFFCLPYSIRWRSAIRVDTFTSMLPKAVQRVLQIVCDVIMLAFLSICVKGGIDVASNAAKIAQKSPALQIPVHILYGVMTFCFLLAIFRTVQVMYLEFTGKKEEK
ncbi:MAG: TRAP transporter small permease [Clostridia bacterium]|nr:TRAP transporter small permease [Clostridia bacterium]